MNQTETMSTLLLSLDRTKECAQELLMRASNYTYAMSKKEGYMRHWDWITACCTLLTLVNEVRK